jgi:phospholipid/cholesterol/gamma-HCH transport system permease protein
MAENIETPLIPDYTIGFATRQSVILEFSTTVVALILSGKVGSNMASELGTMKISEQIDALKIMGINPASHLILPKVLGFMIIGPFVVLISMFLCIMGGYIVGSITGMLSPADYITGVQLEFKPFHLYYALIKTVVFGYIISSVSCFFGYYTNGGALEVGISSTRAVVFSIFAVLTLNLMITGLLLL